MIKRTVDDYHQLSGKYLDKLKELEKKFLITGAAGWLGKATLELLKNVSKDFPNNIACFGSAENASRNGLKIGIFEILRW